MCVCNYSSQTTEPICIQIIPANRAFYADCYRLLRFEIFTKYNEYCPGQRALLHRHIFANGNVLCVKELHTLTVLQSFMSVYVTPKVSQRVAQKVYLCENFQRQSCSYIIPLSI